MTSLSLQQIMSSRFRTSAEADKHTRDLMEALGLSTKANVARLAIGRSLSLGALSEEGVDAKGLEVPASSMFSHKDIGIWVGLITTHARLYKSGSVDSMEGFRALVRLHWHRGARLLLSDWEQSEDDFDKFVLTLANRRAELIDGRRNSPIQGQQATQDPMRPPELTAPLAKALVEIGIPADVKAVTHGPRLSRYKIVLRDVNLLDKLRKGLEPLALALNLQGTLPVLAHGDEAKSVFLDLPRPRESWTTVDILSFREASSQLAKNSAGKLLICPGVDVVGRPVSFDLAEAPHLLVGGATGQGKSVCLHGVMLSLMSQHTPDTLRFALIDPKQVEFSTYSSSKYLWNGEVATGLQQAKDRINDLVSEMDARYTQLKELGTSNFSEAKQKGFKAPYIVTVVDELADLVLQDRSVEGSIVRLAQLARAAGIHLVLATQRPDAKTFSGLIRSNIPARIALTVQKGSESQIILDETGAENLLGRGDMLIKLPGRDVMRVHGYFISNSDVLEAVRR